MPPSTTDGTGLTGFYVHGHLHEEHPDFYRCSRCNGFFSIPFADNLHAVTLPGEPVQSVVSWLRKAADPASSGRHPDEPANLFHEELAAAFAVARRDEIKWAKVAVDR